jgi:hypothetical protein
MIEAKHDLGHSKKAQTYGRNSTVSIIPVVTSLNTFPIFEKKLLQFHGKFKEVKSL